MRLIDIDEIGVMPIDITDLPYDRCLLTYLKEDIDNAPTVKAIPIERLEQIRAKLLKEYNYYENQEDSDTSFGIGIAIDIIDKAIKEQNE